MVSTPSEAPRPLPTALLAACVLVSGAGVMIYEFLAVRFLARDFGGALDVWGFVVAVCLAGLSIGYALGGSIADRYGSGRTLGAALLAGGVTGVFMESLALRAGELLVEVESGVAWHPLLAAVVSSFLPIMALGTVLPQAIRLQTHRLDRVGAAAGWITAVSTVGSIAGVLLATMALLPNVGVRETLYGTSALLVLTGLAFLPFKRKRLVPVGILMLLAPTPAFAQVRFEDYSAYHHIVVQDEGDRRILRFDTAVQSTMSLRDPYEGGFEYTDFFHVPFVLNPTIKSALFLGLGGGSGPKSFLRYYPEVQVTVAEIDPAVVEIAQRFFALPNDKRLSIVTEDGRVAMRRSKSTYGVIVADAYASGPSGAYLPYHLVTQEFFRLAWKRLDQGGCLVYNVIGVYGGMDTNNVRDIRTTLASVFQAVYAFQAGSSLNTVLVAVKLDPAAIQQPEPAAPWPAGPWLQHPLDGTQLNGLARTLMSQEKLRVPRLDSRLTQFSRVQSAPFKGRVFTDNYAPLDLAPGRRR